jgi:hypothetical protein
MVGIREAGDDEAFLAGEGVAEHYLPGVVFAGAGSDDKGGGARGCLDFFKEGVD